ncbi:hypothetical protein [Larkinella soli]|uniref:hypothetical protein n=1 Tax=Larkinella soli TaxID=1770527 RepID=UPI000FFCA049|nr:hypothetical protein [Larkinella soli]
MHPDLSHLFQNPPAWMAGCFAGILLLTLAGCYVVLRKAAPSQGGRIFVGLLVWLGLLLLLARNGFFLTVGTVPPRFTLTIGPPVAFVLSLLLFPAGRRFMDRCPLPAMTFLNTIRVPVELLLYGLFVYGQIPELMTFEGRNLDVLSGLTAPLAGWWATRNRPFDRRLLLFWNFLALGLLVNIVGHAILAAPVPFQQLAFDQPNVGVLKFPYVGLPGLVVPVVLFTHLASLRQLLKPEPVSVDQLSAI